MTFYDRRDYLRFLGYKKDKSGGRYCPLSVVQISGMGDADFILIPWDPRSNQSKTIRHERQHFINNNALGFFREIEASTFTRVQEINFDDYPAISEAIEDGRGEDFMRGVKDELLAYTREGRSFTDVTRFWDDKLYDHLRTNSLPDDNKEMRILLDNIKKELVKGSGLFEGEEARGLLVYHLIDIPLIRFPERIVAIIKFYRKRIDRVLKYIPQEELTELVAEGPEKDRLDDLSKYIVGESYYADRFALGLTGDSLEEQDAELDKIGQKLIKLRAEYDELLRKAPRKNKIPHLLGKGDQVAKLIIARKVRDKTP